MFSSAEISMILEGLRDSLYMTVVSTLLGYLIGLPWGIVLTVSGKDGLKPNRGLYRILDIITNVMRSVPFLILLILIIPLTKLIVGQTYGATAMIVPLTVSAAPFIARMVESSLNEVDKGVIEASLSMGAGTLRIIFKVLIGEARVSLIAGATITVGTILGYSAMAGILGGGGLGDIAIRYGYYRYQANILWVTVILLILLMQIFQFIGTMISTKLDRRKK
ncbi:MAG: ABC transporter permease [Lachnospiraceae bacterium]|nr:ABC transporter permease [Lachnospiraceae bacterium]